MSLWGQSRNRSDINKKCTYWTTYSTYDSSLCIKARIIVYFLWINIFFKIFTHTVMFLMVIINQLTTQIYIKYRMKITN